MLLVVHTCPTLVGQATFLIHTGRRVRATFLTCSGGGVRTIGSAEPSPGHLCSPVTSAISVSLSGVYGWCQHKRRTRARCAPFHPSSSSSSPRAPPASSQWALLSSHLGCCPLDGARTASPSHSAWNWVGPLQQPLLASTGCGWQSGRQSPEGSLCLESTPIAQPCMASPSRYPGPGID